MATTSADRIAYEIGRLSWIDDASLVIVIDALADKLNQRPGLHRVVYDLRREATDIRRVRLLGLAEEEEI